MTASLPIDVTSLAERQPLQHVDGGLYRFMGIATIVHPVDSRQTPSSANSAAMPVGAAFITAAFHSEDRSTVTVLAGNTEKGWRWLALLDPSHAADEGDLVIYEHVWPFEPGVYARPMNEFATRFTPVEPSVVEDAMREDHIVAQHRVKARKIARRAAE